MPDPHKPQATPPPPDRAMPAADRAMPDAGDGRDAGGSGLDWHADGTPVSTRFGDPYFSLAGGLDEARHVFLAGNDLPARLCPGFHIAELGFGSGLNLLALAQVAQVPLRFTSFEAFPLTRDQLVRAHAPFAEVADLAAQMRAGLAQGQRFDLGPIAVEVIPGDVRDTLPDWQGRADAWFLDGFAPARNPEMWGPALMGQVAAHTAPGGTLATYTAAGHVRRSLAGAGFVARRRPGFAGKRHMTVGRLS